MRLRIARHTDQLGAIVEFYGDRVGLPEIGRFTGHDGYDGVFLDLPGTGAHLEFTTGGPHPAPAAHPEELLVLSLGDDDAVARIADRIARPPVMPANPYWARHATTFADPDGRQLVLVGSGDRPVEPDAVAQRLPRAPLFCDLALAARIERAESALMAAAASAARRDGRATSGFAMPLAGGFATFAGDGSPFNKVAGIGFDGSPDAVCIAEVERAFAQRGAPVQIELSELADPAIGPLLTERGYALAGFENVLGLALDAAPDVVTPPGVLVRPSGDDELEAWLDVVGDAAMHADTDGVPSHESFSLEAIKDADRDFVAAGVLRYSAIRDGELAGGASFRIADKVAQMTGAATAPVHRRHGIQTALLTARLADAAAAGCDVAVVTTQPGSKSQQNVQRRGFDLLYARAILVKARP